MSTKTSDAAPKPLAVAGLLALANIVAIGSILYAFKHQILPPFVHVEQPKAWDFEAQIKMFIKFGFYNGLIIFINTIIIGQTRVLQWKVEPQQGQDTELITILNRVLRNNVEQTIAFMPFYLYWLVYRAQAEDLRLAYCFGFYFVLCRLTFFVGYITALFMKTSILRGVGFAGGALTTVLLMSKGLGLNLV